MDLNKFYCRNATPVTSASSSVTSNGSSNTTTQEYAPSDSTFSEVVFSCKEPKSCNNQTNGKISHNNMRTNHCSLAFDNVISNSAIISVSTPDSEASSINNGNHCISSNGNGTYINVMSVPMGTLQYHRRKLTAQEYQSRLYHNSADYRCRDVYSGNIVTSGSGGDNSGITSRISGLLPSPSIQLQGQMHQHNHQTQHRHHHHQTSQHHYHHYNQQQQTNSSASPQQYHQQNKACGLTVSPDTVDETISCALGSDRIVAATQTHQNINCEQALAPTTLTMSSLQSQVAPILYTVHRVVTTAQIQTAGGNTFTSSSSISSVVSALRSEADSMGNVMTPASTSSNVGCFAAADITSCGTHVDPEGNTNASNVEAGQSLLDNSPGKYAAILKSCKY